MKKNQEIVEIFANLPETCEFEPFLPQETGETIVILMENDKTDNVGVEDVENAEKEVDATHLHPPNSPPPKIIERTESNSFSRLSMESSSPEMIESNSDDEKTLLGNSGQFDDGKTYKMVFLGNSGMEKTAMMNGFVNYLKWPRFEDAADAKMEIRIPMEFKLQEEAGTSPMIAKTNSDSENERFNSFGEFVTQKPLTEVFRIGKDTFEILDTPETSDTCRFGQENLKMIQEVLENESELHGICIFLDPNKTDSEFTLRQILALFPKKAVGNMFFFLPSTPDLGFCNSDSILPFKQFVAEIVGDADFDNFFIVDHEALKHFVAENQECHKNYNKKQLKLSWEKTAENVRRFLELLEKVEPIRGDEITFWLKMGAKTKEIFDRTADLASIPDDLTNDLGRLLAAVVQETFPLDAGSYTDWLGDEREPAKLEEVENLLEKLAAKLEAFY